MGKYTEEEREQFAEMAKLMKPVVDQMRKLPEYPSSDQTFFDLSQLQNAYDNMSKKPKPVKKVVRMLKIESCSKCPHQTEERAYTADSFEVVFDWFCKATGEKKEIAGYVEWRDHPKIPSWCPLTAQDVVEEEEE